MPCSRLWRMQLHLGLHAGGSLIQTCVSIVLDPLRRCPAGSFLLQHISVCRESPIVQRIIFPGEALTVGEVPSTLYYRDYPIYYLQTDCVCLAGNPWAAYSPGGGTHNHRDQHTQHNQESNTAHQPINHSASHSSLLNSSSYECHKLLVPGIVADMLEVRHLQGIVH